ncbi:Ves allergen [Parasponia andersonii]|uniref:Ves allergen n=1 Tax=Parasponia andersonii TaxID=3476 RepID=A0A2P5DHQ2_PARAD|nr:Ves allergen [Parasponia andersonii]
MPSTSLPRPASLISSIPIILVISISFLNILAVSAHTHPPHDHHHHRHGTGLRRHHRSRLSREFVHAHNMVRQQLSLPPLTWDRNLARYARRWAAKRLFDCKMMHSYGPYGENIFWGGKDHWTATQAVESWVKENAFYDPGTNHCAPGEMCGHYTQVVWKSSLRVGCTRTKCANGGVLVFCEYDPPGNYINENPFGKVFDDIGQPQTTTSPEPETPSTSSNPLEALFSFN